MRRDTIIGSALIVLGIAIAVTGFISHNSSKQVDNQTTSNESLSNEISNASEVSNTISNSTDYPDDMFDVNGTYGSLDSQTPIAYLPLPVQYLLLYVPSTVSRPMGGMNVAEMVESLMGFTFEGDLTSVYGQFKVRPSSDGWEFVDWTVEPNWTVMNNIENTSMFPHQKYLTFEFGVSGKDQILPLNQNALQVPILYQWVG